MPHPVDIHVGNHIRYRRKQIGMSQQELANCVGVKFQQIQKYENGVNRVSASRLFEIAGALKEQAPSFFEGLTAGPSEGYTPCAAPDLLTDKEARELVRIFYGIPRFQRRKLLELAKALADAVRPI